MDLAYMEIEERTIYNYVRNERNSKIPKKTYFIIAATNEQRNGVEKIQTLLNFAHQKSEYSIKSIFSCFFFRLFSLNISI